MRLVFKGTSNDKVKTGDAFGIRPHSKKPSYFDTSEKKREGTINGQKRVFVLHPKKSGDRVNFQGFKKDEWCYVDDQALWDTVAGKSALTFETAEGRAKKEPEAKPEAAGAGSK